MKRISRLLACFLALAAAALRAQDSVAVAPPAPLTLEAAVGFAARNVPEVRASVADAAAAAVAIDLARTAYLPRVDMRAGVNRATRNNVFGLIFPNRVIPGISGPVQEEWTNTSVFGTSAGLLFSYEPFDLGLRRANVRAAEAAAARASAGREATEYGVALAVVDSYLQAVASGSAAQKARAGLERTQVFHDIVAALVGSELRPGSDAARARAELARARSGLVRAEQAERTALASLAERLGLAGTDIAISPQGLLGDPPGAAPATLTADRHPLAAEQEAEVAVREARLEAIRKEWRPRFEAQSAVYGRGTGANIDGTFLGGGHGLAPTQGNWALGFSMTFDLLEYRSNRAKQRIEAHRVDQERAREAVVEQGIRGEVARAQIAVESARRIAGNTPIELQAAQELEEQERARYRAGLATVADVADSQLLLTQAEVEDALARIGVWRAMLALAAARGSLDELVAAASQ